MSKQYFSNPEAARRYDNSRPEVQKVIVGWLKKDAADSLQFSRAIDIACGTGHSTVPLLGLARVVEGIDLSADMIAMARAKGLNARVAGIDQLEPQAYDLLSICMAFHWFEREKAVTALRAASAPGALWLIYNFWLEGHKTDQEFNRWYRGWYSRRFPAPPRNDSDYLPSRSDAGIQLVAQGKGVLTISFSQDSLIQYLTTQSNVEASLQTAFSYADADQELKAAIPELKDDQGFLYGFSYSLCRCLSP